MSQENVEITRSAIEAFSAGDVDRWLEFYDPELDWRAVEGAIDDAGEMSGTEAIRRYAEDWRDNFADFTVVAEQLLDVGENQVVAVLVNSGRAKLSGIETHRRYAAVYTLRGGKIVGRREYEDMDAALKAAGLEE